MGNQILGKRSRNFFKGFNDRQVDYIKEKFSVMAKNVKDKEGERLELDKDKFIEEYKLTQELADRFFELMNFDEQGGIDEYEFICAVHSFCNMTVAELGQTLFNMVTSKAGRDRLVQKQLINFTEVCMKYNGSLQNKNFTKDNFQKINKDKFKKYDYDKSKFISKEEFISICTKDEDFKKWFFNMGFITKNQLQFNDQVYDLVDSDVDDEIQRHLTKTDPKKDKLKRGFEHKIPDQDDFAEDDDEGDQSAPPPTKKKQAQPEKKKIIQPWETYIKQGYCQLNKKLKQNKSSPSQTLTMKYIFGYRSFDCRNNIKFDSKGNAVYHQGAVGIVMNKDNQQNFMNEHKDDIVCLDVSGDLVVTGQMGTIPSVMLWNTNEKVMKSKLIITDELKESVGNVVLSKGKDGPEFLAVNCNDSDHTLIVYNLLKKDRELVGAQIKSKGVLSKNAVLDLKFTSDSKFIVAASLKQILFVKHDGLVLNASRGQFGQFSNSCALCLLPVQSEWKKENKNWMLSGMTNGSIYFWQQDKCKIARPGHNGSVSALAQVDGKGNNLFISGDKSGNIFVWDRELKISNKCTIAQTQGFSNMIVSLSVYNSDEILVGTKSSTVYRTTLQKDLILNERHTIMSGHCEGNLWGLAVEQTQSCFFYTGGQDQRLMKWRYGTQNKLDKQIKCKYKIRSLSHNPTNSVLAVGYMNGVIQILTEDLKPLSNDSRSKYEKLKNPDKEILNLVKFKKDGKSLAACYTLINQSQSKKQTWGFKVILFSFEKGLKEQKSIELSSKVTALDFDEKGQYLRLNTQNRELFIYDLKGETPVPVKAQIYNKRVKQLEWETHSTFMSPETKGFKTEGVAEADIVCCQRNKKNRNVVLFGDKYSNIKLFNYPCVTYPIFSKYQGHSNAITAMEFNSGKKNGEYLISIGGQEKSIIVWQYDPDVNNNLQFFNEDKTEIIKKDVLSEFQKAKGQEKPATPQYVGQIKQPGHFKETCNARRDNKLPKQDLSIEHVFGIRNQYLFDEVRNQCRFSQNFESILFPTACLGVQMNIKTKKQEYYHEHKEDIVCFAIDKSRKLMATGQMAQKNPKDPRRKIVSICVWDVNTHKLLNKLNGFHTIAVVLLDFSPSGKYLFSVGNDDKNTFAVYDWKAGTIVYSGPVSGGKVNGITWKNQNEFITCGMDHVKFWEKGKGKQGKFDAKQNHKLQSMFSCLYYNDDKDGAFLTGGGSGTVFVWKGNTTVSSVRAHGTEKIQLSKQSKPSMKVHAIVQRNKRIYTGGDDGLINEWKMEKDWNLTLVSKVFDSRNIPKILNLITSQKNVESDECGILSIDFADDKNNSVLAVTKGASVVMFSINDTKGKNVEVIHQGHYKGQLWGLGTFQNSKQSKFIVTGGDDCTVRMWNLESKEQVSRIYLQYPIRAIDCQQFDDYRIVAADKKAQLYLMDSKLKKTDKYSGEPYKMNEESNKKQGTVHFDHFPWIQEIKFSPSGENICYGTHGQSKYAEIVPIQKDSFKSKYAKPFTVGSSAVNHIDWSRSGEQLAINTQAWQYRFFSLASINSSNQKEKDTTISASSVKDENWASYSRKYGFQSQGIFQGPDHTDINTLCRFVTEPDEKNPKGILAAGYDDQTIRLFSYPCYIPNQVHKQYFGHSSHVTKIKFTDGRMVSIGGLDRTVIVWKIDGIPEVKAKKYKKNQEEDEDGDDGLDDLDDDVDVPMRALKKKPKRIVEEDFTQVLDEGDQFMAVKPWLGAIKQPTYSYPKSNGRPPKASIELSHVFGYRAKDCRQNLFYKDQNTIIFHAAAVLIEQNISTKEQKLFNQHNDDILSIDYHRATDRVVTGQLGPKPLVCYYEQGQFVFSIKAPVKKGVIAIAFSPNGQFVACVGLDEKHGMAVLDLKSKSLVSLEETTNKLITKLKWRNDREIIAVGINFYGEWSYTGKKIQLIMKKSPKSNNVSLDISPDGKTILVGGNFSSLYDYSQSKGGNKPVWTLKYPAKNQAQEGDKEQQEPKSVVESIKITDKFIACGMRTGDIVFLDKKFKQLKIIKLWDVIKEDLLKTELSENTCIRSIDFLFEGNNNIKVLVGTLGSQIYQFMIDEKCDPVSQQPLCILKGHFAPNSTWTNEVWGLCIPEGSSEYAVTCSDDSTIRVWKISDIPTLIYCHNVNRNKIMVDPKTKKYPDDLRLRSIAVSPNREFIAVGALDGTLRIFKLDLLKPDMMIAETQLYEKKICKQWISEIKFGFKTLIVGSHDNAIYVFDFDLANEEKEGEKDLTFKNIKSIPLKLKYRPMNKHSSYITHIDVSRDSCFLQSTCGAYEILFWDLNAGKQLPGGATMLKDEKWKSWTCNIGWPVQGIYPKEQDGTFINAVDRSNATINGNTNYDGEAKSSDFYLLAAGNDHGKVCVYNYPSLVKNSSYIEGKGHSSHVTTVRWMANDQNIISVGGEDQCVMVWKVQKNVSSNNDDYEQKEQVKRKSISQPKKI